MKTRISLNSTSHNFTKSNLVTMRGGYDTYKCKCGLEGKRHGLSDLLEVRGTAEKIMTCPMATPKEAAPTAPRQVKITDDYICKRGTEFRGLTNCSVHDVVPCPPDQVTKYGDRIWVMGATEPILLLDNEYSDNI